MRQNNEAKDPKLHPLQNSIKGKSKICLSSLVKMNPRGIVRTWLTSSLVLLGACKWSWWSY